MKWSVFIAKNFGRMVLLVICVSIVTFWLMKLSPVDPLQANVGQVALGSMSQEQIEKLEDYWGVDEPPVQQYLGWAKDFIRGGHGYFPGIPSAGHGSDRGKALQFLDSDGGSLDPFRNPGIRYGRCGGDEPGESH